MTVAALCLLSTAGKVVHDNLAVEAVEGLVQPSTCPPRSAGSGVLANNKNNTDGNRSIYWLFQHVRRASRQLPVDQTRSMARLWPNTPRTAAT